MSSAMVRNPPEGYHSLTAYLAVRDANAALDFYQRALGAELHLRLDLPDGGVAHAELRIGDSIFMLSEECPERGALSPAALGGSPVSFVVYVADADAAFAQALAAGATELRAVADQFYGDRSGAVRDPFGYQWMLATHIEDVSQEEGQRRMEALSAR